MTTIQTVYIHVCVCVFQGVAEAELEKDLERTFKIFFSSSAEAVSGHTHTNTQTHNNVPYQVENSPSSLYICVFLRSVIPVSALQESVLEVTLNSY